MYENSAELAENKLFVLYVVKSLKYPITNNQLTEIILENNFINYFTLQQYISELVSAEFLIYKLVNDKNLVYITDKGSNALLFFSDRISGIKKKIIDEYLLSRMDSIKKELTILSDYTLGNDDSFIAELKALENDNILMELKVSLPSKKQAVSLCNRWKQNPTDLYSKILNSLIEDEN